eukprot:COSAG03_NODE_515_length_7268_cov_2.448598_6_plen_104_part_00
MQPSHALKTPFFVSYLTIVNTGIDTIKGVWIPGCEPLGPPHQNLISCTNFTSPPATAPPVSRYLATVREGASRSARDWGAVGVLRSLVWVHSAPRPVRLWRIV